MFVFDVNFRCVSAVAAGGVPRQSSIANYSGAPAPVTSGYDFRWVVIIVRWAN